MNKAIITAFNKVLPKYKNKVVFYGRSRYDSNHHALIQYMIKNGYTDKYKLYLVVSNEDDLSFYSDIKNLYPVKGAVSGAYHTLTAKYVFHCFGMGAMASHIPQRQTVFDIWHGTTLKTLGSGAKSDYARRSSYMLAASEFSKKSFKKCFGYSDEQFFIGGYPRCEQLIDKTDILQKFDIDKTRYTKVVLYMPTFRKAEQFGYDDSTVDFPLFNGQTLAEFDKYLVEKNILFIIKPHPAQDNIGILNGNFSNVKVIKNSGLLSKNIMLYSLVGQADALLTDYSSIYFDFLLTQKPIGFIIDDINDYSGKRGFVVENPLDYMPGEKIKDIEELKIFLNNLLSGNDGWAEERHKINDLVNFDQSFEFSKKILDFVGIIK